MRVKDVTDYIDDNECYTIELEFKDDLDTFKKRLVFVKGCEESKAEFEFYNIEQLHVFRIGALNLGPGDVSVLIRVQETVKITIE